MSERGRTERPSESAQSDPATCGSGLSAERVQWREVFEDLDDGVLVFEPSSGRIVDASRGASMLFGYSVSELLSRTFWQLSGLDQSAGAHSWASFVEAALADRRARFELRCQRADGSRFWAEVRLVRSGRGKTQVLLAVLHDIEEWKRAREASRLTEERYRGLVKNLPKSAIIMCDHQLRLVLLDGPEIETAGLKKKDMLGKTIYESLPPDFVALIETNMRRVLAGESFSAEIPFGPLWYTYNYLPIYDDTGTAVLYGMILAVNVTERRNAEDALRKSEERFVRIFQSSVDAIAISNASNGKIVEVNPAFTRLLGWEREEVLGKTAIELGLWPDPSARAATIANLRRMEGRSDYTEYSARRRDGVVLDGIVSLRAMELEGVACNLFSFRDISDHKRAELERERLIGELTVRNAEMEQFTFTVSHDLKSPLVTISGFLGLLERDLEVANMVGVRNDIARIGSAANKMMRLLSGLLELSRAGRTDHAMERVALSEIVRDALELLSAALAGRGVRVEVQAGLPELYGDRVRLVQVVQNLVENAIKYLGDQPAPLIEIGVRPDPRFVVCFVKDNGMGIDPRYAERIFGLFDKLNTRSEGTGIGLALVRRILEAHGGSAWVESDGQHGSTFVFRIPRKPSTPLPSLQR